MFRIREMADDDLAFAVKLTNITGWDMSEDDFKFIMNLEPNGCFVLLDDSTKAGLATNITYGKLSWFGNLVVKEDCRGKGGGSLLVKHSLNYLTAKGTTSVGLYSYKEKIPFYENLGFKRDREFIVFKGKGRSSASDPLIKHCSSTDLQKILSFDTESFGAHRTKMLKSIISDSDTLCFSCLENGSIVGYALAKIFGQKAEYGPLVCKENRDDVAIRLVNAALGRLEKFDVSTCVSESESTIVDTLTAAGLREDFRVTRMFFGKPHHTRCTFIAESLERG